MQMEKELMFLQINNYTILQKPFAFNIYTIKYATLVASFHQI